MCGLVAGRVNDGCGGPTRESLFCNPTGEMGALDDAIREHLELKRRLGTSEDELKRKEDEAFGRGRAWQQQPPPEPPEPGPAADHPAPGNGFAADNGFHSGAEGAEIEVAQAGRPLSPVVDEVGPDEVLPEDSLELDEPRPYQEAELESPAAEEPDGDMIDDGPEFLDRTPEQDQLWFDKNPPKDFDFGE
jgi:hypothetical protein